MRKFMLMVMAALAMMPALIWDGVRWTWRVARAVLGAPAPDVSEAFVEADAVEIPAAELSDDEETGLAALALVAPFAGEESTKALPAHQEHYVRSLTVAERMKMASKTPDRIGRHLRGVDAIAGLPVVPTAAQHSARILDTYLDIRDGVRPEDIEESNRKFSLNVIQELLDDLDQKLAA
ncbi:hypothetical protein MKK88_21215 [Methylobacterium sp. E-005]|uniref:hypothetical protein n=1 Tax=Methylobacterium sp. E-005 TaxID=2836549 RepID=UPI001FBB8B3F|nr:hypothetical protein [Methylobacterium sp. E-005]MCJ2088481.1 hypothetical protein [Methylobacterium sp. E-005]